MPLPSGVRADNNRNGIVIPSAPTCSRLLLPRSARRRRHQRGLSRVTSWRSETGPHAHALPHRRAASRDALAGPRMVPNARRVAGRAMTGADGRPLFLGGQWGSAGMAPHQQGEGLWGWGTGDSRVQIPAS